LKNTLCIVTCGSRKKWDNKHTQNAGPTAARNVYTHGLSRAGIRFAEKFFPEDWCIMSAKYGFIFPDEIIPENYNEHFDCTTRRKVNIVTHYGLIGLDGLMDQANGIIERYSKLYLLAGKCYIKVVREVFPDIEIESPLHGIKGNIGMQGILSNCVKDDISIKEARNRKGI